MNNIAHLLKIKYGLSGNPPEDKIKDWITKTENYISNGYEAEKAGKVAAEEIFSDYETIFYASQADTIMALLAEARKK